MSPSYLYLASTTLSVVGRLVVEKIGPDRWVPKLVPG